MDDDLVRRIANHPRYEELRHKRMNFGLWMTAAVFVAYYGFILLVAFDPKLLGTRIGAGVMTLGVPLGAAVILVTIVLTALYVRRANSEFDAISDEIVKGVLK